METRKESLSTLKICRFCLSQDNSLLSLYENKNKPSKNSVTFSLKILSAVSIEVFPSDKMPQYICKRCKFFMDITFTFKQICRQADETILQYVGNGTPLHSVSWPAQLNKVFRAAPKTPEAVVKTVVQDGATVQVMAEEISDSEEGDNDNVYNVKIGDGIDELKNIKVITTEDNQSNPSGSKQSCIGIGKNSEEAETPDEPPTVVESGRWPCDQCDRTYPLEQLLILHKSQKHRTRNVQCNECDAKFFTKYDLMTHQLTHSVEMPFQCVACDKRFKRLILLKRHEKLMHAELPQQVCPHCPATFLSIEELEAHQKRHDLRQSTSTRPFVCNICDKRFREKALLQRHNEYVHSNKPAFSCQYCAEQFPSVSKLTRHVREHAGRRMYPCKHCDKSFVKSHHYFRHLRLKHQETTRTAGDYNESDAYRCDECEETFATQDELMYHSALHATRNLICPLCQEKFDDVDTVTVHIKSHVNGTEFMCDFCELIFTTKEKLDAHIARAHGDELLANEQDTDNDEWSMDMDAEEEDEYSSINVKDEGDHMVVEINKTEDFMVSAPQEEEEEDKVEENTQSEDSVDASYASPASVEKEDAQINNAKLLPIAAEQATITKMDKNKVAIANKIAEAKDKHKQITASILLKAEQIKRKAAHTQSPSIITNTVADKKPANKMESPATGASDKSLRLLEKELQDLKRTNSRNDAPKAPSRAVDTLRNRRPQLYSSTPKLRASEKLPTPKSAPEKIPVEKKQPERKIITKENKEPKDAREAKTNNNIIKEDKELKDSKDKTIVKDKDADKDEKKEVKEKDTPKSVIKNGASEKPATDEPIRRSTRPSKVKDYAKMIQDKSESDDDSEKEDEDEEYKEVEKTPEASRSRGRRSSNKSAAAPTPAAAAAPAAPAALPAAAPAVAPRKRGRPRKEQPPPVVPSKIKKDEPGEECKQADESSQLKEDAANETESSNIEERKSPDTNKSTAEMKTDLMVSPTGQTLKKVPIKALPPGVKPLPLPANSRLGGGEVCEMQIGKKMVKVQKIVMTKAEVEAMAKKGLVEMKDGTMVLKQGIKLPAADSASFRSLVGEGEQKKESPSKQEKAAPTRCDIGD